MKSSDGQILATLSRHDMSTPTVGCNAGHEKWWIRFRVFLFEFLENRNIILLVQCSHSIQLDTQSTWINWSMLELL